LGDRGAALAGELGVDVAHDLEAGRHILQHFGYFLAQRGHGAPAGGAAVRLRRGMDDLLAGQGSRRGLRQGVWGTSGGTSPATTHAAWACSASRSSSVSSNWSASSVSRSDDRPNSIRRRRAS
jgi:hypothetical protein